MNFDTQHAVLYLQIKLHEEMQNNFKYNVETFNATKSATKSAAKQVRSLEILRAAEVSENKSTNS